jgi:hypothetical protein
MAHTDMYDKLNILRTYLPCGKTTGKYSDHSLVLNVEV